QARCNGVVKLPFTTLIGRRLVRESTTRSLFPSFDTDQIVLCDPLVLRPRRQHFSFRGHCDPPQTIQTTRRFPIGRQASAACDRACSRAAFHGCNATRLLGLLVRRSDAQRRRLRRSQLSWSSVGSSSLTPPRPPAARPRRPPAA